jgi:hypothetical protein
MKGLHPHTDDCVPIKSSSMPSAALPGANVVNFKVFSPTKLALLDLKYCRFISKNAIFSPENSRKSPKIAENINRLLIDHFFIDLFLSTVFFDQPFFYRPFVDRPFFIDRFFIDRFLSTVFFIDHWHLNGAFP